MALCGAAASALQLLLPLSTILIINRIVPRRDAMLLAEVVAALAVATVLSLAASFAESVLASALRERMVLELQRDLFAHLQRLPFGFFKSHETGYTMARVSYDPDGAVDFAVGLTAIGRSVVWFGAAFLLVPAISWAIGLILALVIPLYAGVLVIFHRRIKERFVEVQEATALASRELFESLTGVFETKACAREGFRARRYVRMAVARARSLVRGKRAMELANSALQVAMGGVSLIVVAYGTGEVLGGKLSLGEVIALSSLVAYVLVPVNGFVQQIFVFQRSRAAVERVEEILAVPAEEPSKGRWPAQPAAGRLRFEDVGFSYDGERAVLGHVTFEIQPGETVLFLGPSGQGKTTLMSLVPRFYLPTEGRIWLDGQAIDSLDLAWLRSQVAYVSQDTFLFSDTVLGNIRLARPEATAEEVWEAARLANATEFVRELPEGLATIVGERGCRLSGGQRQRIAIARAVLRQAPILILDEATSAVDRATEGSVHQALARLIEGRTTLVVAHHAEAFLSRVDRVFEVQNGAVREVGRGARRQLDLVATA